MRVIRTVVIGFQLAALLWYAAQPTAIGPAWGSHIDGPPPLPAMAGTVHLRVATYNIHGGVGTDGRRDLDRLASNSRGFDFLALNEVHGPAWGDREDQAAALGRRLNQGWLFAPATQNWSHGPFGNGLVTRLAIDSWRRIPLAARDGHGQRNAIVVAFARGGRKVHLLLTHIVRGRAGPREEQLAEAIDLFLSLPSPAILLGDLNSTIDSPTLARLLARPDVIDAVGQATGDKRPGRIDWIIVRGLRCVAAGVRNNGASDHPLFWAELE